MREAAGAAFSSSILQHNNIINSSSNIPSLCHADEWCSNEPVPVSGYTAVICQLYAATSRVHVCVCAPLFMGMSDRYTRIPELWVHSRRPSALPLEYKEMMKRSFKEVRESRAKTRRERIPAGLFIKSSFSWPSVGSYSSQNSLYQFKDTGHPAGSLGNGCVILIPVVQIWLCFRFDYMLPFKTDSS